jgi:hypothetical protein
MRLRTFLALVVVLVLGWDGVAHAKGPTEGTIEGDSLSAPIVIAGDEGGSSDFWNLVEQSGYFPAAFKQSPDPMLDAAPTDHLGPAFLVTWRMPFEGGVMDTLHQTLYPYADGGPLAYTEPGQPFFGREHSRGGWYRADHAMPGTLARLGVPVPAGFSLTTAASASTATAPRPTPTTVTAKAAAPAKAPSRDGSAWWPGVGIVALVATLAAGGFAIARHRVRMSPA